jgi:hypothetical protein
LWQGEIAIGWEVKRIESTSASELGIMRFWSCL